MRPPVKVPNCCPTSPRLSVQLRTTWYSPGWITLLRELASLMRVSLHCRVIGRLVEKAALLEVVPVTANGLLSGKVAVSGACPFASTGPTMIWLTACVPTGQAAEGVPAMAVVSVPVAGAIVSVPSVPGGIVALAIPFASNTDPAVTAPTTAPDINRINTLFSYTIQLTFTEEMGPNRRHEADGTAVRDRAEPCCMFAFRPALNALAVRKGEPARRARFAAGIPP